MRNLKTFRTKAEYDQALAAGQIPNPCVSVVEGKVYYYPDIETPTPSDAELRMKNQVLDVNETGRVEAEKAREKKEKDRQAAELLRVQAEEDRKTAEAERTTKYTQWDQAEQGRASSETQRAAEYETLKNKLTSAAGSVEEIRDHLPYVGTDNYVYEWNTAQSRFDKTEKYVKGERGESGRLVKVIKDAGTDLNVTIEPGTFTEWTGELSGNLTIALGQGSSEYVNEYAVRFTTGTTIPRITFPSSVKVPRTFIILPNHIYTCTIVDGVLEFGGQSR
jgi:hypothetical protein